MEKTPEENWKEMIHGLRSKCKAIVKSSPDIRYAGAINSHGRTLAGIMTEEIVPLLPVEHARNELFTLAMLTNLREPHYNDIGDMDHTILHHKRVIIILIKKDDIMFYVSVQPEADNINDIVKMIKGCI